MTNTARYREAEQSLWQARGVAPQEQFLQLRQNNVRVRVQILGEGPDILFVHGGNVSGTSWADLVARLPGYRCILLDRPGCGLSEPLPTPLTGYTLPSYADSLVIDVLDALGIERAHLAATSFGSYVALRTIAAYPQRISKLVLYGWPWGTSTRLPAFMRMTGVPGVARMMSAMPVSERAVHMIFRSIGHGPTLKAGRLTKSDVAWYESLLRDTETLRNEMAPLRALISVRSGVRSVATVPAATLGAIQTPTLMLWGENDPFGNASTARTVAALMPNATLELLPAAGHAPWLDALDRCSEATCAFLAERPPVPPPAL